MNILFVYERKIIPSFGGLERVTFLISQELRKRGNAVSFLSVGPSKWNEMEYNEDFPQAHIEFGQPGFKEKFRDFVLESRVDVIIFQGHNNDVLATVPFVPPGVKTFSVYHYQPFQILERERMVKRGTPWKELRLKGKMLKALAIAAPSVFRRLYLKRSAAMFKRMAGQTDGLVLLSDKFFPRIKKYCPGIDSSKLSAINNPLTFGNPSEVDLEGKEKLVVFVARMNNPQKNITGFIDVWLEFSRMHPDWKAEIVGSGEHEELVRRYALKKRVRNLSFEGARKNVDDYYRRARIYCMTSIYEGWGMVLTEAMAFGCVPVVYESYESVRDIITPGVDGLLVKPFDIKAMVGALGEIADNDDLRLSMAHAAMRSVTRFEVGKIVNQWEKLMQ